MHIDETRIGKARREATRATNRACMAKRNGATPTEQRRLWAEERGARQRLRDIESNWSASVEYRLALYGPAIVRAPA